MGQSSALPACSWHGWQKRRELSAGEGAPLFLGSGRKTCLAGIHQQGNGGAFVPGVIHLYSCGTVNPGEMPEFSCYQVRKDLD